MDIQKSKKLLLMAAAFFWLLAILIYIVAYPQFRYSVVTSDALSASTITGELVDGGEIRQRVVIPAGRISSISLMAGTYERTNTGEIHIRLEDAEGRTVMESSKSAADFVDLQYAQFEFAEPQDNHKGEAMTLVVSAEGCSSGNALTLYTGYSVSTGRFSVEAAIPEEDRCLINGVPGQGMLCVRMEGVDEIQFYKTYWLIVAGAFAVIALLCAWWWKRAMQGQNNPLVMVCTLLTKYSLLLKQLVSREFKAKYKRSMLGVAWSFLNPLLTMAVQYIVFSTLFRSDVENYPLYLLTGIVLMNFFTESVSLGMTSITSNAALIKKVYMPKYIYPITRVIASSINFLLSLIPLLLVMVVTQAHFRPSLLLLVFDILCLQGFVMGMCLLLATAMTFFQDTQFLWSVISMLWFYLTPVFYPESIISQPLRFWFRLNPMYQYITFARTCIIGGVSPEPMAYLWCMMLSLVVLSLGMMAFKKNQDKFVLYI